MQYRHFLPHHHSGKLASHRHTSYIPLCIMLLFTVGIYLWHSNVAYADTIEHEGEYGVYATVPSRSVPTAPTLVVTPTSTSSNPVVASGSCSAGSLVKVFRNGVLAGANLCSQSRSYRVTMDLFAGRNEVVAAGHNSLDEKGPDSNTVIATYNPPGVPASTGFINLSDSTALAAQPVLTANQLYKGVFTGGTIRYPISIVGGSAPYAVSVSWGDGEDTLISRPANGEFTIDHTYKKAADDGAYDVVVKIMDRNNKAAYLQLVAIVNDRPGVSAASSGTGGGILQSLQGYGLTALTALALAVVGFFVGEYWQRRKELVARPVAPV